MRSVLSFVGLFVSVIGFVAFIGLIVGAWWAKREADRQVADAVSKAEAAADLAGRAIGLVKEVIARADSDLVAARIASAEPAPEVSPFVRLTIRQANRQLPADMERARDAVGLASDAMVVANAALDVFADRPEEQARLGINPNDMKAAREHLDAAARDVRNARSVLGLPFDHPDMPMTDEEAAQMKQALDRAREFTNQLDGDLANARQRIDTAKRQAHMWTLRIALGATVLGSLGALGQLFLARACVRGLRKEAA
ncbi:MAG TPA: hypothetical protein VKE74_31635 [Gemmataceae bacterium]|nr:hypothetical protein [Gemmataceae bacterium]